MKFFIQIQFLLFFLCFSFPENAKASVIEFNSDGSTTVYEAIDYIQQKRRKKHPYISSHSNYTPPKEIKSYDRIISKYSKKYSVDANLIKAVIAVESSYNHQAVSPVGARGLMQLMPMTAKRFNVSNSFDPEQNIRGGTKYLSFLNKLFDGDIKLTLAAYNAGEGAVQKYKGIPPYRETVNYVPKVLSTYKKLNQQ